MTKILVKVLKGERKFTRLVGIPGQIIGMRSGFVVLNSGKSVGLHNTEYKEEAIIILKGKANISYGSKSTTVREGSFIYVPRNTFHNVENVGNVPLKYVYVTTA